MPKYSNTSVKCFVSVDNLTFLFGEEGKCVKKNEQTDLICRAKVFVCVVFIIGTYLHTVALCDTE